MYHFDYQKQKKRFAVHGRREHTQLSANKADTSSALDKRRGVVLMGNSDAVRIGLCGTIKDQF